MKALSKEQSVKVLELLASVSSKEHGRQVVKRNEEALEGDKGSAIHCPHCSQCLDCGHCLWTWAVEQVSGEKLADGDGEVVIVTCDPVPCLMVQFLENAEKDEEALHDIDISCDYLGPYLSSPFSTESIAWLKAHIEWGVQEEKWGIKTPPEGYRTKCF